MNARSIRFRITVWYAGVLAALLVLFGATGYIGLERYLQRTLSESLSTQARQIGDTLIANVSRSGEDYVIDEIKEHYAPAVNNRFLRITRFDGSVLYASGLPKDGSFDATRLPVLSAPVDSGFLRTAHLPGATELVIYTLPFGAQDGGRFLIEAGAPYKPIESVLHGLLLSLAIGLPMIVAIAIAGAYLLTRRALAPVDLITRTAERITSRNLSERLPVTRTGDELERLSISLNRMIARIEHAFQHIGRFTADASHELRTPLTVLHGELEAIVRRPHLRSEDRETIGSALEETERLANIVEKLLTLSRLDAGEARMERVHFDLAELTATTVEQMRLLAEDKRISLHCDATSQVEADGDCSRLRQVVVNLLDNAIKYTPEGGSIHVSVRATNGKALLEVADNGIGIPAGALPHVFERFYRADKARSRQLGGVGLGLSIVKSICAAHGGQVKVESVEGQGSRFRAELPLATQISRKPNPASFLQ